MQNIYGELAGEISPLFKERGGMTREQLKFLYEGGEALFIRYHEQFGGKEDRQITLLREVISHWFGNLVIKNGVLEKTNPIK